MCVWYSYVLLFRFAKGLMVKVGFEEEKVRWNHKSILGNGPGVKGKPGRENRNTLVSS